MKKLEKQIARNGIENFTIRVLMIYTYIYIRVIKVLSQHKQMRFLQSKAPVRVIILENFTSFLLCCFSVCVSSYLNMYIFEDI